MQIEYGGQCHISGRPYTVFRWRPGKDARYKKTIICQEVAKAKNVCQVCLNDLDYNLPVQVRDQALGLSQEDNALPESVAGREYALNKLEEEGFNREKYQVASSVLQSIKRDPTKTGNYSRNRAKICSFFVKGECKRGAECPYRHELPDSGHTGFSLENIQNRYHGRNDPTAGKILKKLNDAGERTVPPEDKTITTLFVGGVEDDVSEDDIRNVVAQLGELKSVKKIGSRKCAFVTFRQREAAEDAHRSLSAAGGLRVNGRTYTVLWGKPKKGGASGKDGGDDQIKVRKVGSLPKVNDTKSAYYPSMDPNRDGTAREEETKAAKRRKA
jgi:pre-mRNA-splicing factor RBM22/SLT11